MYTLCFHKLVFWIVMESHGMERRKSFVGSTWGEEENLRRSGRRCGWRQRRAGPLQEDGLPSISWGFPGREGRRVARSLLLLWSYSASREPDKG